MALTTFRTDGSPVVTPVWFITDGADIKLWTGARTAKVRRLRQDPRCTLAPCTMSGRATGAEVEGYARVLPNADGIAIQQLLRAKYPLQKRGLETYAWLRRRGRRATPELDAYVAITITR